jgi:L-lysine 2,3-aminomutase
MVIHANHPQELSESVISRLGNMIDAGIPVLNQAVLLRGVNDQAEILIDLCRCLVNHRIQPYYLHQLDRVRGAAHFEVPVETGRKIIESLRAALPGFAVPQYVVEEPGAKSKSPILDTHCNDNP